MMLIVLIKIMRVVVLLFALADYTIAQLVVDIDYGSISKLDENLFNNNSSTIQAKIPREDVNLNCATARFRRIFHITSLMISIGFCIPAIIIFLSYRIIRSSKLILIIINLILAVTLRNFVVLIAEADKSNEASWACKVHLIFENMTTNYVFASFWMQAHYLRRVLLETADQTNAPRFVKHFLIGIGTSTFCAFLWAFLMFSYNNVDCWSSISVIQLINDIPCFLMAVSTIFLLTQTLFKSWKSDKIKMCNESLQTAKAASYSLPVFIVSILLIELGPEVNNCGLDMFFYVVVHTIEGIFSISVVYLHFYCNQEVQSIMLKLYCCCKPKNEEADLNQITVDRKASRNGFMNQELFVGPKSLEKSVQKPLTWQDVVHKARNSIDEVNLEIPKKCTSTRVTMKEIVLRATGSISRENAVEQPSSLEGKTKFSMKDIVLMARNSLPKENVRKDEPDKFKRSTVKFKSFDDTPSTPPLPKDIPDQILDDIQLFDFYYKNLGNFRVAAGSQRSSISTKNNINEETQHIPVNNPKKHNQVNTFNSATNSITSIEENNETNSV